MSRPHRFPTPFPHKTIMEKLVGEVGLALQPCPRPPFVFQQCIGRINGSLRCFLKIDKTVELVKRRNE